MSDSLQPHGLYSPWNSPCQNIGAGSHSLLQGIFPTQGASLGLPHDRQIHYQLSHQECHSEVLDKPGLQNIYCTSYDLFLDLEYQKQILVATFSLLDLG